jgi:cytoskeleton protein RodZ
VRAGDDLIATRLLREGERFQVPDRNGLTLMVGNAAGLRIVVDGRTLPPLGNAGEVRRGIRLAPEALLAN